MIAPGGQNTANGNVINANTFEQQWLPSITRSSILCQSNLVLAFHSVHNTSILNLRANMIGFCFCFELLLLVFDEQSISCQQQHMYDILTQQSALSTKMKHSDMTNLRSSTEQPILFYFSRQIHFLSNLNHTIPPK